MHPDDKVDTNNPDSLSVLEVLKSKHPYAQQATAEALIQGPVPSPSHPVICDSINAASIHTAALHTKGAAGPSGLDAHCWRRLCTSFKSASHDLCHALALVAKRLCTTLVDPSCLSAFLACQLIALDKCPGVRPIGICETVMIIIAKAVLHTIKSARGNWMSAIMCRASFRY